MSNKTHTVANLHCVECKNYGLLVCLGENGDLVIACEKCNSVVMTVDKWPNEKLTAPELVRSKELLN